MCKCAALVGWRACVGCSCGGGHGSVLGILSPVVVHCCMLCAAQAVLVVQGQQASLTCFSLEMWATRCTACRVVGWCLSACLSVLLHSLLWVQ